MHLKRQKTPKNWPIERKGMTFVVKPTHNIESGIPILVILRDLLGLAKNKKEVKKAINSKQILLNGKLVKDEKNNALLFDIVTIITKQGEKNYRIGIGENKKYNIEEIDKKEADKKVAKIINKKLLKNGKIQINLSDGRNFISDTKCNVEDSVLVNLKDKKIEKVLPLKEGSNAVVFAGKHAGEKGTIKKIEQEHKMARLNIGKKDTNVLIKQLIVVK